MSGAPQSSSSVAANDTQQPAPQTRLRPEKPPTRGPFWARLPALRTMTSTVSDSQSQAQEAASPAANAPLPIALPDRVSTTRILLSDTQACIQKLSARMDIIGSRSEQALKEVQLAREALDTGGEKITAEITDVVYRCQATLSKNIEMQESILDKINGSIAKLTTSSDALLKLYEAHNAALASLTQTMHSIMKVQQSAQAQHTQVVATLAPLEPLMRSIPLHFDALVPNVERVIERSLERVLSQFSLGAYMREQRGQDPQTPRGQKRQHSPERVLPPIDSARIRRRSTRAPAEVLTTRDPSSPLTGRQRSGVWGTERLQTRGSLRLPAVAPSLGGAHMEAEEETCLPQVLVGPFSRRTSRRPTLPNISLITGPVNKRPRTESAIRPEAARGDDVDALQPSPEISGNTETVPAATVVAAAHGPTSASASTSGLTRNAAKAQMLEDMIPTSRVPLGSSQLSVNNGIVSADKTITQTPSGQASGSENVQPSPADKITTSDSSKSKSKTPKKKGGAPKKARGRPKKATSVATSTSGASLQPGPKKKTTTKSKSKSTSKDTSPKRAITGNSDVSAASEHGPPNSPSTHTKSSPVPSAESNVASSSPIPEQITTPNAAPTLTTLALPSKQHTMISLIDASQESSTLAGQGDCGAGLTAALAHMDSDINFTSTLGTVTMRRQETMNVAAVDLTPTRGEFGNEVNMFNGSRMAEKIPSEPGSALFKGRTKRFLVIDNSSSENDILDELFAE